MQKRSQRIHLISRDSKPESWKLVLVTTHQCREEGFGAMKSSVRTRTLRSSDVGHGNHLGLLSFIPAGSVEGPGDKEGG